MNIAILESIIFNNITGHQSSPITEATTLASLRVGKRRLYCEVLTYQESMGVELKITSPFYVPWHWLTIQDVLNDFPVVSGADETGNP